MSDPHEYSATCNCESCFVIWMAGAEVEKAAAHERGEKRRQGRVDRWLRMIEYFERLIEDEEMTAAPVVEEET